MGYLLGGLMWFCIPFTLATTLGLSALALDLPISIAESNAGAAMLFASPHNTWTRSLPAVLACLHARPCSSAAAPRAGCHVP